MEINVPKVGGHNYFNFIQSNDLFFTWDVEGSKRFDKYSLSVWDFKKQRTPIFVVDPPNPIRGV